MSNPKETIEEAANQYAEPYRCPATNDNEYCKHDIISAFNKGAKWQAERMYSEEEVIKLLEYVRKNYYDTGTHWHQEPNDDFTSKEIVKQFKQFKK
jgi:hypothetical protein